MTIAERHEYEQAGIDFICVETVNERQDDGLLCDVDALAVVSAKVRTGLIGGLGNCKVISRYGNGIDNIGVSTATSCGIMVTNVPNFCLSEMADHTVALVLGLARKLLIMDRCTRTGKWQAPVSEPVRRVAGKTLGLELIRK
jgi:D-3-phosphoglycerate dehydrogenase / 2-oxoglutarate reductase